MAKYWASVSAIYDYYTAEIEAETEDEARSIAYDRAKAIMAESKLKLRPFGISVTAVGKVEEQKEG